MKTPQWVKVSQALYRSSITDKLLHLRNLAVARMDAPFVFDTYVTGKAFIGRKAECNVLGSLLERGDSVALYEPPKSGKMSLIQQTLLNMRIAGKHFSLSQMNLFNISDLKSFLLKFGNCVIRSCASTPAEYAAIADKYLAGTNFTFDLSLFSENDEVVSLECEADENDIRIMMKLPHLIAEERHEAFFVIIEEFQNLMQLDCYEHIFSAIKEAILNRSYKAVCCFILSGSKTNAMKYIFDGYKYFHKVVEHIPLSSIDDRDIIEYVVKGFLTTGKVIERDLVLGACRLFKNNLWYLNHFLSICDSLTKGYINEGILMESLRIILSIHEPKFLRIMSNLTGHQISFLKAVMEGVTKFSATEIIEKYSLNSSANVRRVKDALCKKEIITFNEKDEATMLDPLFEYWLGKYYFELSGF